MVFWPLALLDVGGQFVPAVPTRALAVGDMAPNRLRQCGRRVRHGWRACNRRLTARRTLTRSLTEGAPLWLSCLSRPARVSAPLAIPQALGVRRLLGSAGS